MIRQAFVIAFLLVTNAIPQTPAPAPQDAGSMEQLLREASDLQASQPQGVAEKLAPVLSELRSLQSKGALNAQSRRVFQEALLLLIRTKSLLLSPEDEILPLFREYLIITPKVDDNIFNPREKVVVNKVRSAETGHLTLQTDPPGCTLSYLGTDLGNTPAEIPLIAGNYRLLLRKDGYLDQEFDVTVQPSEILTTVRKLRRRTVVIPLSIAAPATAISLNGQKAGQSEAKDAWLASLPAESRQEFDSTIRSWNVDSATSTFYRLQEVPVGETVELEFRAPCYEPLTLSLTVKEQEVDWAKPFIDRPELRRIVLKKDTGFLEVSSFPTGADVWFDGILQGKTPLSGDVCVGSHRVQVLHDSGQYVREVTIRRGQASKIAGELKPALGFLGIYEEKAANQRFAPLATESQTIAKALTLHCTAFADPQLTFEEVQSLHEKGNLPVEQLFRPETSAHPGPIIEKMAAAAGRVNIILTGLRKADKYTFLLFSTIQPIPDRIELPNLEESSLDYLVRQLNRSENIAARLQEPQIGVALLESDRGLVVQGISPDVSAGKNVLVPGALVRSVDRNPMTFKGLYDYLRTKKAAETVMLDVSAGKDTTIAVPLTLRFSGTEYPWNAPDGFFNSVLSMLHHLVERDPLSDRAKYARLSLARGLMQVGQWNRALEILAKTNLEPLTSGICPGTVLYYQGRCYEALGNREKAESSYTRAKDYPEATLGTPDGIDVFSQAEARLQVLKNKSPQ